VAPRSVHVAEHRYGAWSCRPHPFAGAARVGLRPSGARIASQLVHGDVEIVRSLEAAAAVPPMLVDGDARGQLVVSHRLK
jgi:hypothetical protein